ncbi:hypothetical protein [Nitrosomonas sp. Nm34]|uniref:hypothetical protein n=1 Tax=Nitrosomonas sp. Nm34 TaxID=1881055 RepID=UPI0008E58BBE|nr:hypothetical protein [Nitrosomonas sp. Nm34]SFI95961.1 hypothetical protein SAMN05428978_10674 [Nitrosomonas sp. Nm34]
MNQQNSAINKKVEIMSAENIYRKEEDGTLLAFCVVNQDIRAIVHNKAGKIFNLSLDRVRIVEYESEQVTGWQPIETAPMDGTEIDVWVTNLPPEAMRVTNVKYDKEKSYFVYWDYRYAEYKQVIGDITHWMPIPKRPLK